MEATKRICHHQNCPTRIANGNFRNEKEMIKKKRNLGASGKKKEHGKQKYG